MIKVLEDAVEKIKELPEDRQAYAAEVLQQIAAASGSERFVVPNEHLAAVSRGSIRPGAESLPPTSRSMPFSAAHGAEDTAYCASDP